MEKIYGLGRGGKHRNNREAATWRFTTTQVAEGILAAFPEMTRSLAITHAEDETAIAFRAYNRKVSA